MNTCFHCGIPTANPKYCSRSHAAIHTNKAVPKRKPQGSCLVCQAPIHANRQHCAAHKRAPSRSEYYDLTVAEFKARNAHLHPSYYRGQLNTLTRLLNAHRPRVCQACGYCKHVEYCHIQPLEAFPATTTIRELSGPDNIFCCAPIVTGNTTTACCTWTRQDSNLQSSP